jgi:hypothetical protein
MIFITTHHSPLATHHSPLTTHQIPTALQPVPSEKMYGLGKPLILGKVCFRYIVWAGEGERNARLRL